MASSCAVCCAPSRVWVDRPRLVGFRVPAPPQRLARLPCRAANGEVEKKSKSFDFKLKAPSKEWAQEVMEEVADTSKLGQRGELWFAAQVAAMLAVVLPPEPLRSLLLTAGGAAIMLAGFGLLVGGQQSLGENLTPLPKPRDSGTLVTSGIYALCRHPMYGGLTLAGTGLALCTGDELRLLCALVLFLVVDRKASYEEQLLEERFGQEYADYKKTAKKLIPYIY